MAESVQMNLLVKEKTARMVETMALATFRTRSGLIEYLVAQAWEKFQQERANSVSAVDALTEKEN